MLCLALPPHHGVPKLDFQSEFSMSKIIQIFTKIRPNFVEAAKLGKAICDAYNLEGWLILYALLKNWVAEGVVSEVNDKIFKNFNNL